MTIQVALWKKGHLFFVSSGRTGTPAAMRSRRSREAPRKIAPGIPTRAAPSMLMFRSSVKKHSSAFRPNSRNRT